MDWDKLYEIEKAVSIKQVDSKFEARNEISRSLQVLSADLLAIVQMFSKRDYPRKAFQKLCEGDAKWKELSESQFERIVDDLVEKDILRHLPLSMGGPNLGGDESEEILLSDWNSVSLTVMGTRAPSEHVKVGNFCNFADGVKFLLGGQHNPDAVSHFRVAAHFSDHFDPKSETAVLRDERFNQVVIKNEVWIGYNAVIMGGVTIGNGAVIGANSHVMQDVPDFAIVAGNPAKVIRYRFPKPIIEKLLQIQWWHWSEEKIRQEVDSFDLPIEKFVEKYAFAAPVPKAASKPMETMSVVSQICTFLDAQRSSDGGAVEAETDLFKAGILTSLRFFELITYLENTFGVSIALDEVEKKNFATAKAIVAFVDTKKTKLGT